MVRFISVTLFLIILLINAVGCSSRGGNSVVAPNTDELISTADEMTSDRMLWGVWEAKFDLENLTAEVFPSRDVGGHINITSLIPSPIITIIGYDAAQQIANVVVTIKNPYNIEGYDVRLILYTNDEGLLLTNDDSWTDLYDIYGGRGQNPFKAYCKYEANRKFPKLSQQTEQLLVYVPSPSGAIKFAVDASYPTNCLEPYEIKNFAQTTLYDTAGSSCDVSVQVLDWQNDVNSVKINAYSITGEYYTPMSYQAAQGNWKASLTNVNGKPAGKYECLIMATSANSGYQALYDYVNVVITPSTCPTDSNNSCSNAEKLYMKGNVTGCIDPTDISDWYYIFAPPGGIQGGTITLQYSNGSAPQMYVYGMDPGGGACPGTLLASGLNVNMSPSANSLYYIHVTGASVRCEYQLTVNLNPALINVPCEIYVAKNSSGRWPIWEAPDPDIELNINILLQQMSWTNSLWNQYGYNLVWDGTVTFMATQYYVLNSSDEAWQMHQTYGAKANKVSLYFCDVLNSGVQTAYAVPFNPKSQNNVVNVFTVYSPNVWFWQQAVSHEHGHVLGYFFDQYIFDIEGVQCGNKNALPSGYPIYLYADPLGCYNGNLMWYYIEGWPWSKFDITKGQWDAMNSFHYYYYNNFPWY